MMHAIYIVVCGHNLRQNDSYRLHQVGRHHDNSSEASKLHRFLKSLDACTLPVTVEENESIAMVRLLTAAGMLQAVIPPWDEATRGYSGPAWVIRMTQKGLDTALEPSVE
jgi:hypothetical protein